MARSEGARPSSNVLIIAACFILAGILKHVSTFEGVADALPRINRSGTGKKQQGRVERTSLDGPTCSDPDLIRP
jgi:hypothetical protein